MKEGKMKTLVKYPYLTEDVEIYERENGHKIVLAHKEGELVNISTWVKTGSINEETRWRWTRFVAYTTSGYGSKEQCLNFNWSRAVHGALFKLNPRGCTRRQERCLDVILLY